MTASKSILNVSNVIGLILLALATTYILFNKHGVVQNISLKNELNEKQEVLVNLQATKHKLDTESKMLSNDSLDLDFLEEQARLQFNVIGADEIQINIEE